LLIPLISIECKEENINTEYIKRVKTNTGRAIIIKSKDGENRIISWGGANNLESEDKYELDEKY